MGHLTTAETVAAGHDEFLNIAQASAFLKLTRGWIYQLINDRKIPFFKLPDGRRILFSRLELAEWVMKNRPLTKEQIEAEADRIVRRSR